MQALTRDGTPFTPTYLEGIDTVKCIGCGRCFKVCGQEVMTLRGVDEDGEFVDIEDEDDDEFERKVMVVANAGACIGCGACARVCTKGCQSHAAAG
ncbi:ferredoxin III, nif-specific [Consotaella aegiceratis]|uniref:ferredoxin III, nif-specific n=1 Tax=Consotaella aegiceratis TaxID=3097961 RepID=UPI002F3E6641